MGKKLPEDQMQLYSRIDEILWYDWDPIGVCGAEETRDEYYGYLPHVFHLVLDGAKVEDIARHLTTIVEERMGAPANELRDMKVARMIVDTKSCLEITLKS